jgi:hypothetical protein
VFVVAFTPGWERHCPALNLDVHGRVDQGKEAVPWSHARETGLLALLDPPKEGFHGGIQAAIDLVQQCAVDPAQFWVMLFTGEQGLLRFLPTRPLLPIS